MATPIQQVNSDHIYPSSEVEEQNIDLNKNDDDKVTSGKGVDALLDLDKEIWSIKQSIEEYNVMMIPEESETQKENDIILIVNEFYEDMLTTMENNIMDQLMLASDTFRKTTKRYKTREKERDSS